MTEVKKKQKPKEINPVKPRELVKLFKSLGFREIRQTGNHLVMRHPDKVQPLVVPIHCRYLHGPTISSLIKIAGLTKSRYLKLLKER